MKYLIAIISFFLINLFTLNYNINQEKKYLYLFTRSTKLKRCFIAEDFNIKDTLSTHIGIGIKHKDSFIIYNVSNDKKVDDSSLIIDNLNSFINIKNIKSYSIWKTEISEYELNLFKKEIDDYLSRKIIFDNKFKLSDKNILYCSEFVYNLLKKINENKFYYKPNVIILNQFYAHKLKRNKLKFIPVDFFIKLNLFNKVETKIY